MLGYIDFFMANTPYFLANNPQKKEKLIEREKSHKPECCLNCIFFEWLFDDGRISDGRCAIDTELKADCVDWDDSSKRLDGCPLDR